MQTAFCLLLILMLGVVALAATPVTLHTWTPGGDARGLAAGNLIAMDLDYNPFPCKFHPGQQGTINWQLPAGRRVALLVWVTVKGPENTWQVRLPADNKGRGYALGDDLIIEHELARTRAFWLSQLMQQGVGEGCHFSADLMARVEEARALLRRADAAQGQACSQLAWEALGRLMKIAEDAVWELSTYRANKLRGQAFSFGANAFSYATPDDEYAKRFLQVMNFGTVPFYLASFEPARGAKHYERPLEIARWLKSNGATPKGHPLVWFYPGTTPDWLRKVYKDEGYAGLKKEVYQHVYDVVAHCKGTIETWDVINEAHGWANCLDLSLAQLREITRLACDAARASNPDALLVVNNCWLTGEYVAGGHNVSGKTSQDKLCTAYQYLQQLLAEGADFDVIGLQLYYPSRDMFEIYRLIDRFAGLGKPIHITELAVPASMEPDKSSMQGPGAIKGMGLWRRPWDEALQAEWGREFYTLCYGHPDVQAVVWWDFSDVGHHFFPHGGFIAPDGRPRQSFLALRKLEAGWGIGRLTRARVSFI